MCIVKKDLKDKNTIASIWCKNMHGYLSLDIMFLEAYPCIFSLIMEAIVYIAFSVPLIDFDLHSAGSQYKLLCSQFNNVKNIQYVALLLGDTLGCCRSSV